MKRIVFLALAVMLVIGMALMGCGKAEPETTPTTAPTSSPADDGKVYELKFSYHTPPQASLVGKFFEPWTAQITEATDGRVQITHYPSATLVALSDQYDAVVSGLADMAMVEPDITPGRFPLSEFNLLPFTFPDGATGARVNYEILEKYAFDSEWSEVKVLVTPALPPMNYHGTKEVKTLEDMQGLKIRSGGKVEGWINEALGATPVEMDTGEISTSIERGLIDGAWLTHSAVMSFGVKDVTQYRTLVGLFPRAWVVVMNMDTWNSLPDDIKQIIESESGAIKSAEYTAASDAAIEATGRGIAAADKMAGNPGFYTLPEAEKARWKEAVQPVYDRWIESVEAKGLPGKQLLDDAFALIEEYAPEPEATEETGGSDAGMELQEGQVSWEDAEKYAGETATICGPVVAIADLSDKAHAKKLLIGKEEGGFQVSISNDDESKFPALESYVGKTVCVTGTVDVNVFAGVYEIVATDPSAITMAGDGSVSWENAEDYAGETATIYGPVVAIADLSDKAHAKKLLIGKEEGGFQVSIANDDESKFPALDSYVGKTVYVTGTVDVNVFAGVYEIVVTDPSAIAVK